jgi:hypothetical protein
MERSTHEKVFLFEKWMKVNLLLLITKAVRVRRVHICQAWQQTASTLCPTTACLFRHIKTTAFDADLRSMMQPG